MRMRQKKKKINGFKILLIVCVLWAVLGGFLFYKAKSSLMSLNLEKASSFNTKLKYTLFYRSGNREIDNLLSLLSEKKAQYEETASFSQDYYSALLNTLLTQNKDLKVFNDVSEYLLKKEALSGFYSGLYFFNKGDFVKAQSFLKDSADFSEILDAGKIPIIRDIMVFDTDKKVYLSEMKGMSFLETHFTGDRHFLRQYDSTIDVSIQGAAYKALDTYDGSVIVASEGKILGMVAKNYDPLEECVEAASVIKLITLTAYLNENSNSIEFPFECKYAKTFSGKSFGDWKAHGKLESFSEALACSCNLVFGETGVSLSKETLMKWYDNFQISDKSLEKMGELSFNSARIEGDITDDFDLANAAIGLNFPRVSGFWLVKTASIFAGRGTCNIPDMFSGFRVAGVENTFSELSSHKLEIGDFSQMDLLYQGMKDAVIKSYGTVRRAETDGVTVYAKTGTSGDKPFNSLLLGFCDIDERTYSFGILLKNGGKAEYNGAKVLKTLLEELKRLNG